MATKAGPFSFAELEEVTALGRGEIRECVRRKIISAPAGVGQGNHRAYSRWNLVEGVIAAALLRQVRAGVVEKMMEALRVLLDSAEIDIDGYILRPKELYLKMGFPTRYDVDDSPEMLVRDDEVSAKGVPYSFTLSEHPRSLIGDGAGFAGLVVDLRHAVQFTKASIDAL